ncbi:glyoxalase-like domain-containing protein [Jackrogersella minutella]|nr:glyoxalase-like domain-containing protein [Jackrogersella minutella]
MASSTTPLVDHIVILIPHSFLSAPPSWFAELFHFYPGGQHADGLTENTLALLADGSYLEFIAFVPGIDPARRAAHHWGSKREGTVIDWAVTLPPSPEAESAREEEKATGELGQEKTFRSIQQKVRDAHAGIVYADLRGGGRTRPDGEVLKWAVAFPERDDGAPLERGTVPFWCLDVTPRGLRVPGERTKHPTGAVGVAKIEVSPGPGGSARGVYDALFGPAAAGGSWGLSSLAGEKVHSGGAVALRASGGGPAGIDITFFTDDESLAGKSVGGKVDEEHTLTFRLVAAFDGSK